MRRDAANLYLGPVAEVGTDGQGHSGRLAWKSFLSTIYMPPVPPGVSNEAASFTEHATGDWPKIKQTMKNRQIWKKTRQKCRFFKGFSNFLQFGVNLSTPNLQCSGVLVS